ncbi:MAG: pyridoxal-phosphate dependent enzyme [Melioribacteraceae bacterium]|nr:pyridoxal-phosphate dependent enzyme [Melioribacteraceae bacterium]
MNSEKEIDLSKAVLQKIIFPEKINVDVFVKRFDLIHPFINGNKYFKLKYNLQYAKENNFNTILTFGGAYSNHIHATAAAGKIFGFETIGIIRGEEHLPLNPTLSFASKNGMKLFYVSRSDYRKKNSEEFYAWIKKKFGDVFIVPEGGSNQLAIKGASEIPSLIEIDYDYVITASGTAGTLSGLIVGLNNYKKVLGVAVLKGAEFLNKNVEFFTSKTSKQKFNNWSIVHNYHFGGYAKINRELLIFINQIEELNEVKLDPIYTGKMLYAVYDLARKNYFEKNKTIVCIHTGGLQGIEGMKDKMNFILSGKI